jgi:hydroxyacylglutathione hydrolase
LLHARTPQVEVLKIVTLTVGPFQENCYLLADTDPGELVIVDPGDEAGRIAAAVKRTGCSPKAIWLTHAHVDHVGGIAGLQREWQLPVFLHDSDLPLYEAAHKQAAFYGLPFEQPAPPDNSLSEGDELQRGDAAFTVMHMPGHAPGHVIFVGEEMLIAGDLVFMGSIGRTDLPLSNPADMARSLQRLSSLPADLAVHPGHGPSTSLGREFASNPFLNGMARVIGG